MVICKACKLPKDDLEFYTAKTQGRSQTLQPCRACRKITPRARDRRQERYGLQWWVFDLILKSQDGKCAGCYALLGDKLFVDHDHTTGQVRGLLCNACNSILGMAKDNPQTLRTLADYLIKCQGVTATPSVIGSGVEHGETRVL